ncbi:MAG: hypothetical protein A2508_07860 [Candidatus Lambdaproteobacteria bacterium RIFOXYD12_FULL_49_8]|nr:MAG: hypothetical protein A2508_07860 [Candidatus Lambdaproteobacteria bacterium RIFOXYD12_FULL_49_8]
MLPRFLFSILILTPLALTGCGLLGSEPEPSQEAPAIKAEAPASPAQEPAKEDEEGLFSWLWPFGSAEEPPVPQPVVAADPEAVEEAPPADFSPSKKERWTLAKWAEAMWEGFGEETDLTELTRMDSDDSDVRRKLLREYVRNKLNGINTIFVQSFTGENLNEVRTGLYASIREQGKYQIVEILPDSPVKLAVLRIKVEDFSIWDIEEKLDSQDLKQLSEEERKLIPERIVRRNALIGVRLALFDAETGLALVRGRYSQPFQQIYVGQDATRMPSESKEMSRLTEILITKILNAFEAKEDDLFGSLPLERGTNWGWYADFINDAGDRRIVKGNEMAQIGQVENAISLWRLVLYGPDTDEPASIYRVNRASAFFNLGVAYNQQQDYLFAAKMFSQANRLSQKLLYAQAWGDNMHAWLDQKNRKTTDEEAQITLPEPPVEVKKSQKQPDFIELLEGNENLLLKAQDLWPLEPIIKNANPQDLNGTKRSKLDLPAKRYGMEGYIEYPDEKPAVYPLPQKKEKGDSKKNKTNSNTETNNPVKTPKPQPSSGLIQKMQ